MDQQPTVFSQLIQFLPHYEFSKCVKRYKGDYRIRAFSCMDQFLCMAFAQLTYRESLRDIEACLCTVQKNFIIWAFVEIFPGAILQMPTNREIGESTQTLL